MANNSKKYLLAIEWDNPFSSDERKGLLLYSVSPKNGTSPEEFEKFIKEKAFPAINGILTRAIRYSAKYLLVDTEGREMDALDNHQVRDLINENLAEHKLVGSFLDVTDTV